MLNPQKLDEFAKRLGDLLPESASQMQSEIEKNMKAGLQGVVQKMDLVTREEYEVQREILTRTRENLIFWNNVWQSWSHKPL